MQNVTLFSLNYFYVEECLKTLPIGNFRMKMVRKLHVINMYIKINVYPHQSNFISQSYYEPFKFHNNYMLYVLPNL